MRRNKWIFSILFLFFFTGCYNYRELTQIALTSAIGIDKTEDGSEYIVTAQVLNTQKQGSDSNNSGGVTKFILYKQQGATLQQALRTMIWESPRRLYVNHINLLLISERVAQDGIEDIREFFARNTEFRKDFLVVISREENPEDVMQILTPLETLNSKNIHDSIMADVKYYGMAAKVPFEQVLNSYLNNRTNLALPSIEVVGDKSDGEGEDNIKQSVPDAVVKVRPLAIFKDNKMVGYLTDEESRVYNYIHNNIQNTIVTLDCPNEKKFTAELMPDKTKMKTDAENMKITISIKANGSIKETNCGMDLLDPNAIKELEEIVNQSMKKQFEEDIEHIIQTYKSDIFGFEETLYKTSPNAYKKIKQQYKDELIENLEFEVSVDVNLQTKGNIVKEIIR